MHVKPLLLNRRARRSTFLTSLLLLFACAVSAQHVVTGKVVSAEDNLGLPGTNILLKGSTTGTVTDSDGNYRFEIPSSTGTLVFSSIGYSTVELEVAGRTTIDVSMVLDVTQLTEVVVVGYGTVKKSDITGALSRVTGDMLNDRPTQNMFQALQGKAAGVNVSSNIKPGELPVIRIRGNRSLAGGNDPLYVIDGIPLVTGSMNDISPNDIASIEVLKDASATAIYGSRGANGVVLITTKRGSKGRINVNYSGNISLDHYKSLTDWMNGGEYIDRWRQSLMNGGLYQTAQFTDFDSPVIPGWADPDEDVLRMGLGQDNVALESVLMGYEWVDQIGGTVRTRPTTAAEQAMGWPAEVPVYNSANVRSYNWLDDAVRQGVTNNHQISLSSGTDNSKLYISLDYFNQLGVQRDQDYERFTTNIGGDISPTNWLTLGISTIASNSVQNFGIQGPNTSNTGSKDLYSRASDQFPYALPRDENGAWIRNPGGNLSLWNPLIDIDQSVTERRISSVMANMFTEVKFAPWIKYRMNFGTQVRQYRNGTWTGPNATSHLTNRPNTASYNTNQGSSWVMENLIFIDKTLADKHNIGVTLLQSAQKSRTEGIGANVSNMIYDISYWYDLASNSNGQPDGYGTSFVETTLMSWMGRVNYSFNNKYLLTATGRYDGASVLAPGHKWHFFPSFALAWKAHEESFFAGFSWLNELKPRIGYGEVGNSSVQPYTTSGPLNRNPYTFGGTPAIGFLPSRVKNPELAWERTEQLNIGLDFAVLGSRVSGSLEYYNAKTPGLIMEKTLPAVSGYVTKLENIGETQNKGVELTLSAVVIDKGDFTWTLDLNWARNKEEIVELINGKEDMLAQRLFIGQPTQVYFQYDNAGIWGSSQTDMEEMAKFNANGHRFHPGTIRVVDQNGDYRIDGNDQVIRGTNRPDWTGGVTTTFQYKNLTLSSFIYARVGQTYFGGYPNSYGGVWPNGRVENDVWSFDNQGGRWPMPNFGNVENITASMQYNNGSFGVVRHISLNYVVPQAFIGRIGMKNLQVGAQVLNPFIFGGDVVKMGLNPDDETNWDRASSNSNPLGGTNNNTILQQSWVFSVRAGF